jgi:hypothetical protein
VAATVQAALPDVRRRRGTVRGEEAMHSPHRGVMGDGERCGRDVNAAVGARLTGDAAASTPALPVNTMNPANSLRQDCGQHDSAHPCWAQAELGAGGDARHDPGVEAQGIDPRGGSVMKPVRHPASGGWL